MSSQLAGIYDDSAEEHLELAKPVFTKVVEYVEKINRIMQSPDSFFNPSLRNELRARMELARESFETANEITKINRLNTVRLTKTEKINLGVYMLWLGDFENTMATHEVRFEILTAKHGKEVMEE